MFRIGLGQDSHSFSSEKKPLILGGFMISPTGGLEASSDGDVIIHSLCNALSSAIGGNSLGTWADKMCLEQGIKDSKQFLTIILEIIKDKQYSIENISLSVEAKKPKLSLDLINSIKNNLSSLLNIPGDKIGITFTSGDGLTAFGMGKGMQVLTIVLLKK